jgi:hypothetical protein
MNVFLFKLICLLKHPNQISFIGRTHWTSRRLLLCEVCGRDLLRRKNGLGYEVKHRTLQTELP